MTISIYDNLRRIAFQSIKDEDKLKVRLEEINKIENDFLEILANS